MDGMLPPGSTDFAGSMTYHLGTDQQGRDMLSAIIFGLRMSLGVGVMSTFIALSLGMRSEEHTSELQSLMRISYAVFCLKKKIHTQDNTQQQQQYKHNIK